MKLQLRISFNSNQIDLIIIFMIFYFLNLNNLWDFFQFIFFNVISTSRIRQSKVDSIGR